MNLDRNGSGSPGTELAPADQRRRQPAGSGSRSLRVCTGLGARPLRRLAGREIAGPGLTHIRAILVAVLLCLPAAGSAETVEVGSQISSFSVADQFGKPLAVDDSVRAILFVRDRVSAEVMKRALADQGSAQLAGAGAVYVSDMSGVPELIRKYVAIPMLRKRGYAIGVDQSGSYTRDFPSHEKQPTLLVLDGLRITRLEQLASIEAVRTALAQLKAPETAAPAAPAEN